MNVCDLKKKKAPVAPIIITGEPFDGEDCFKFLDALTSSDMGW